MRLFHACNPLRGRQEAQKTDVLGTRLFQQINRRQRKLITDLAEALFSDDHLVLTLLGPVNDKPSYEKLLTLQ